MQLGAGIILADTVMVNYTQRRTEGKEAPVQITAAASLKGCLGKKQGGKGHISLFLLLTSARPQPFS